MLRALANNLWQWIINIRVSYCSKTGPRACWHLLHMMCSINIEFKKKKKKKGNKPNQNQIFGEWLKYVRIPKNKCLMLVYVQKRSIGQRQKKKLKKLLRTVGFRSDICSIALYYQAPTWYQVSIYVKEVSLQKISTGAFFCIVNMS